MKTVGARVRSRARGARAILTAAAMLALIAVGCSGGDSGSEDAQVLPLAGVQASGFVFEADPANPGQGIFRMTTTEPMICSIAWGESDGFGNFNTDRNMMGTGITEHTAVLPGAQPGQRYFFRVQGSTADGQLYQSEIGSFTIPEPDGTVSSDSGARDEMSPSSTPTSLTDPMNR